MAICFGILGYKTSSGISGTNDNSMFDFFFSVLQFEGPLSSLSKKYTILHCLQQCVRVPVSPHLYPHLLLSVFNLS